MTPSTFMGAFWSMQGNNSGGTTYSGGYVGGSYNLVLASGAGGTLAGGNMTTLSNGFSIAWQSVGGGYILNYLALGGTDLSVKVGSITPRTTTGAQSITGVGFVPDAVMFLGTPTTNGSGSLCWGVAQAPPVNRWDMAQSTAIGFSMSNSNVASRTGDFSRCFDLLGASGVTTTLALADLTSMDADGFTLNWQTATATAITMQYMAFGGAAQFGVNYYQKNANTTDTSFSIPFSNLTSTPIAYLMAGMMSGLGTAQSTGWENCFGATDGTNSANEAWENKNAVYPTQARTYLDSAGTGRVARIRALPASVSAPGTTSVEVAHQSFSGQQINCTMPVNQIASAMTFAALAFAPGVVRPAAPTDLYGTTITGTSGLLHYWRMAETSGPMLDYMGTADMMPSANVVRGATSVPLGLAPNPCAQYVTAVSSDTIKTPVAAADINTSAGQAFTAEMWFYWPSGYTAGNAMVLMGLDATGTNGWYLQINTSGVLTLTINQSVPTNVGLGTPTRDTWHHIAIVKTTGDMNTVYIDGVQQGGSFAGATGVSGNQIGVGCGIYLQGFSFRGYVDEAAWYNTALTLAQVQDHYNKGYRVTPPAPSDAYGSLIYGHGNLVHYWRLDENTGVFSDTKGVRDLNATGSVARSQASLPLLGNDSVGFAGTGNEYINGTVPECGTAYSVGFSLEFWFNATFANGSPFATFFKCMDKPSSWYRGWNFCKGGSTGYYQVNIGDGTAANTSNVSFGGVSDNQWHHVIISIHSTAKQVWIWFDGATVVNGASFLNFAPSQDNTLWLGEMTDVNNNTGFYAPVAIDEVAWYNSVLSGTTAQQHYQAGGGGPNGATVAQATSSATLSVTNFVGPAGATLAIADYFNKSPLNTSLWGYWGTGGTMSLTAMYTWYGPAMLYVAPNGTAGSYGGVLSNTTYDARNKDLFVRLYPMATPKVGQVATIQLQIDSNNYVEIGLVDSNLVARKNVAGVLTTLYSAAVVGGQTRWLRITESTGWVFFSTSTSDNLNAAWTPLYAIPDPFVMSALLVNIVCGCYTTVSSPTATAWSALDWWLPSSASATGATVIQGQGSIGASALIFTQTLPATTTVAQAASSAALTITYKVTGSTVARGQVGGPGGSYSNTVLSDAPMLYWRLGESAGTTVADSSGNGRSGTFNAAGATLGQPGLIVGEVTTGVKILGVNNANAFIQGPFLSCFQGGSPFTVEAWIYTAGQAVAADLCAFTIGEGWSTPTYTDQMVYGNITNNCPKFDFNGDGFWSGAPVDMTQVHHFVWVYEGTGTKMQRCYVDGVQNSSRVATANPNVTAGAGSGGGIRMGGIFAPQNSSMLGVMDEFAVYPTALSQARVQAHYQAGAAPLAGLQINLVGSSTAQAISSAPIATDLGQQAIGLQASSTAVPSLRLTTITSGGTIQTQASSTAGFTVRWPIPPLRTTAVLGTPYSLPGRVNLGQPTQIPVGFLGASVAQASTTGALYVPQPLPSFGAVTQSSSSAALTLGLAGVVVAAASSTQTGIRLALSDVDGAVTQSGSTAGLRIGLVGATATQAVVAGTGAGMAIGLSASGTTQAALSAGLGLSLGPQSMVGTASSVGQVIVSNLVGTSFPQAVVTATLTLRLAPTQIVAGGAPTLTPSVPFVGYVLTGASVATGAPLLTPSGPFLTFVQATGGAATVSLTAFGVQLNGFFNCWSTTTAQLSVGLVGASATQAASSANLSLRLTAVAAAQASSMCGLTVWLAPTSVAGFASSAAILNSLLVGATQTQASSSARVAIGLSVLTVAQGSLSGLVTSRQPLAGAIVSVGYPTATILSGFLLTSTTTGRGTTSTTLLLRLPSGMVSVGQATVRAIPLIVQIPTAAIVAQASSSSAQLIRYMLLTGNTVAQASGYAIPGLSLALPPQVDISRGSLVGTMTLGFVGQSLGQATVSGPLHVPFTGVPVGQATSSATLVLSLAPSTVHASGRLDSVFGVRLVAQGVAQADFRLRIGINSGLTGQTVAQAQTALQTTAQMYRLQGQSTSQAAFSASLGVALVHRTTFAQASSSAILTASLSGAAVAQATVRSIVLYANISGSSLGQGSSTATPHGVTVLAGQTIAQASLTAGLALRLVPRPILAQSSSAAVCYVIEPVRLSGAVFAQARHDAALGLAFVGQTHGQATVRPIVFSLLLHGSVVAQAQTSGQALWYTWLLPRPIVTASTLTATLKVGFALATGGRASSSAHLALTLSGVAIVTRASTVASLTPWVLFDSTITAQAETVGVLSVDRYEGTKPGGQIIFTRSSQTRGGGAPQRTSVGSGRGRVTRGYPIRVPTEDVGPHTNG